MDRILMDGPTAVIWLTLALPGLFPDDSPQWANVGPFDSTAGCMEAGDRWAKHARAHWRVPAEWIEAHPWWKGSERDWQLQYGCVEHSSVD